MKVGEYDIEVTSNRTDGGWEASATMPDGKKIISAPHSSQEGAEHDVFVQARARMYPQRKFDINRANEAQDEDKDERWYYARVGDKRVHKPVPPQCPYCLRYEPCGCRKGARKPLPEPGAHLKQFRSDRVSGPEGSVIRNHLGMEESREMKNMDVGYMPGQSWWPVNHPLNDKLRSCPKCGSPRVGLPAYSGDWFDCIDCGHSWPMTDKQRAFMASHPASTYPDSRGKIANPRRGRQESMKINEKKAKLGSGKRFAKLERSLSHQKGIRNPAAVAAAHGRKALGKKRFQQLAAAGRRRHKHESVDQAVARQRADQLLEADYGELSHVGMSNCYLCGEPKEIILDRRLRNVLPRSGVYNKEPCDKCKGYMQQGVMFLSVRDGEPQSDNPYRTGKICVIRDEAVERMPIDQALKASILKSRVCFIEDAVWKHMGFPGGDVPEACSALSRVDQLLEHCGHCVEDFMSGAARQTGLTATQLYDIWEKDYIQQHGWAEFCQLVSEGEIDLGTGIPSFPPAKASFYPSDGGSAGGGGGITSA